MNNRLKFSDVVNLIIGEIKHSDSLNKDKAEDVLRHLESLKQFELNLSALSLAIMNIRSLAQNGCREDSTIEEKIKSLIEIESLADRMHNVPGFMLRGIECDALYLYRNGIDQNWPSGLIAGLGCISSVFHPNPSANLQNYEGLSLSTEEFDLLTIEKD